MLKRRGQRNSCCVCVCCSDCTTPTHTRPRHYIKSHLRETRASSRLTDVRGCPESCVEGRLERESCVECCKKVCILCGEKGVRARCDMDLVRYGSLHVCLRCNPCTPPTRRASPRFQDEIDVDTLRIEFVRLLTIQPFYYFARCRAKSFNCFCSLQYLYLFLSLLRHWLSCVVSRTILLLLLCVYKWVLSSVGSRGFE